MDKFILKIAVEYRKQMRLHKRQYRFPKCKDLSKTYHYRYFSAFVKKCKSEGYSDNEILEIVGILVNFADENDLVLRGPILMSRKDIVDECLREFERKHKEYDRIIADLKWCLSNVGGASVKKFITKRTKRSAPNIVLLKSEGKITDNFIACSRAAFKAITMLDESDKIGILSVRDYVILKSKIINNVEKSELRKIMGSDLNA
jgi:hypothetical protein